MTLQEHIDALDRMITQGTSVPELRSQIAFIGREVAALEADHASLADEYARLHEAYVNLQGSKAHETSIFIRELRQKADKLRKSHALNDKF